ncbi:MAG: hypothetical protein ACI4X9_01245 [Kiritimatiellia bacterium]
MRFRPTIPADQMIVLSSRVRYARNLEGFPFPTHLSTAQAKQILATVSGAFKGIDSHAHCTLRGSADSFEAQAFLAEHQISHEFLDSPLQDATAYFTFGNQHLSAMVNEEDHIRLQSIRDGLALTQCLDDIRIADKALADILPYAANPQWGYLAACPTNSGTGFRASLMVHLGALTISQNCKAAMMRALEDLDLNCRGYFGEVPSDCEPFLGPVYQISNRKASGETEEQVVQRITQIANDLTKRELDCRLRLLTTREGRSILRAHTLRHLALAVNQEQYDERDSALDHLLNLYLPAELGLLKDITFKELRQLATQSEKDRFLRFGERSEPPCSGEALTIQEFFDKRHYRRGALSEKVLLS